MNTLQIEYKNDFAIVRINNGKVNAISSQLSADIRDTFLQLEKEEKVKGLMLTGRPHCFSAGLDVMELATGTKEDLKQFWVNYLQALQAMVRFSKPFVCAITGFAPAGGTIYALCADYRVMARGEKHVIGMHEFKMSMQIPEMLCDIYAYVLGEKRAWESIQNARLFDSDQALKIGLVHQSEEVEAVEPEAEKQLLKLMRVYAPVYKKSKGYFRKGLLKIVDRDITAMVEEIASSWDDPFVRQSMELFLASLKKK